MLYIVGTPIGNLDDLSIRQAKTIASSDVILAEDTRSLQILFQAIADRFHFPIARSITIISYYKEKEFEKLPYVLELLKAGKNVTLVSESGMPLVSDPGYLLVNTVIKEKIPYTVIPGPVASVTAIIAAGFNPQQYMFLGFLPKKNNHIVQLINRLNRIKEIMPEMVYVFYESPKRINKTLALVNELLPDADIAVCRELTKKFEEVIRGKPKDLINRTYKGEIAAVLSI